MKKVEKRLLSWLMVMAMVLSVVHISVPVKAEEQSISDSKVDIGTPSMKETDNSTGVERAKYNFNGTLKIEGTEIRSVSVQFVSLATKDVEEIKYTPESEDVSESTKNVAKNVEISSLTTGNSTHMILNSTKTNEKGDILPLKAEEWESILRECIVIYIKSDESRSVMVSVSEEVDFGNKNLIEYNANNGHYYELVQSKEDWDSARENSLKADSMGPLYESYLVNITSSKENAFVYTICSTTSWIGTTCDPKAELKGSYDKNSQTFKYDGNIQEKYGYTLDFESYKNGGVAYWFYVDGPEAGKVMTYGPAQKEGVQQKNNMKPAIAGEEIKFDSSHTAAYGAYETDADTWENHGDNNWANENNWEKSALKEDNLITDDNRKINEPNNCSYDNANGRQPYNERYMVIYSREDYDKPGYGFMIPSMWNDFNKINTDYIGSYIIEYSPKPGEVPDFTLDNKQSIVELDGKNNRTIKGENFAVIGKSGKLEVKDIVKEENGNVKVTVNGNPSELAPEISVDDLNKLNDAIDKNEPDVIPVKVKDTTTKLETTLMVTIIPKEEVSIKSAVIVPYRAEPGNDDTPGHYIAGETIKLDNVTLNDGTVYRDSQLTSGNFTYKWQYSKDGSDSWHDIDEAISVSLSSELTKEYAGNKVRLVISVNPKGELKDIIYNTDGKIYVDGDGYSDKDADVTGTYIDKFTIDASDFVVSVEEAKGINDDDKAAKAAGVDTELSNYGSTETKTITTSPTSNVKDENGLSKITKAADVPVKFSAVISVDDKELEARDKNSYEKVGKTVTAFVKDNADTVTLGDGTKIGIGANNITITLSEAAEVLKDGELTTQSEKLSKKAEVVVVDDGKTTKADNLKYNNGNGSVKVSYNSDNTFSAEIGRTYPVTYTYTNSAGEYVYTVADVIVISNADITATDFIISIEDANKADEDDIKKKAGAVGKDDSGDGIGNDKLDVDDTGMEKLKDAEKPGDIPVVISNIATVPNLKAPVIAHVVDKTGMDEAGKITIGANNFNIYPEDVKKALGGDTDILKTFAGVIATDNGVDVPFKSINVSEEYKNDLKMEPGKYPVTFTYTNADNKTVTVKVDATVKVPSVDANDFIINTTDAKNVTEDIVKEKAGATGFGEDCVLVDKSKIEIDANSVKAIKDAGEKEETKDVSVIVTNTNKEPYPSKTITAHVVDATKDNTNTENDPDKQVTIGANNFFIIPADADKAKGVGGNDDILKNLSKVLAIEGYKDVPVDEIKVTKKDTLDSQPGDYPITFAYKNVDVTVTATVKASDVSKAGIDAHDIIISLDDVEKVTEDNIKNISEVKGKDAFDNPIKLSDVDVKDEDVDSIKEISVPDMIPVELKNTKADPNPTKKINAYIVDKQDDNKDTQPDPEKQISIGANNFDISVEDVKKAIGGEDKILRQLSAVVALDGGKNVDTAKITVSDKSELKVEPGKYPVTFSYTNASNETATVTVEATVKANGGKKDAADKDDNNKDNGDGEEIAGNDFTVEGGSTPLEAKDIIDKGNVYAVDGNGTPIILPPNASVNKDDLDNLNDSIKDSKKGTYPVKVTTPNGTSVTVNVTVTDKNDDKKADDLKSDETIAANNFKIGVNDYDKIFNSDEKDDNVKKLSNALAYVTELKTPVNITLIDTSAVAKEPGTYPVTLATDKGTTTTIMVMVDKDWDTIGDIDQASDSNKSGETTDNVTAKKVEPIGKTDSDETQPVEQLSTVTGEVKPEDITYEKTNPQDKIEPIDPNKKIATSNALKINGELVPDDKYSVSPDGAKLIISRDYLATLAKGTYPAVLSYADGTTQTFNVSIVDYDETTLVKNPPLFSMYKEIVLKKKNTFTVNLKGISEYAKVSSEITAKSKKAKKVVSIKQQKNGDVLITPKKTGKTQVTCTIIQNGAEYKVVVDIKVLKQYKGTSKNYNLKTKGLVKTSGELPEFNVYKRIVKGKNTKIKFTKVATDAKVKFYVANKKEAKSLKIGKVKRKGKTATCTIVGKKKGWVHLTAEITQNGKTYYTRLLVRIDDGTWSKKQISKYLK